MTDGPLTESQIDTFQEQGFVVVPGLLDRERTERDQGLG